MEAWSSLHSSLQAVAPEPHSKPAPFPGEAQLYDALAMQHLPCKAGVYCGTYQADAVLSLFD